MGVPCGPAPLRWPGALLNQNEALLGARAPRGLCGGALGRARPRGAPPTAGARPKIQKHKNTKTQKQKTKTQK